MISNYFRYIPSDFFFSTHSWHETFPLTGPLKFRHPSAISICNKGKIGHDHYLFFSTLKIYFHFAQELVEPLTDETLRTMDAPDADYRYSAKVMLMAVPSPEELYQRTCLIAGSKSKIQRQNH